MSPQKPRSVTHGLALNLACGLLLLAAAWTVLGAAPQTASAPENETATPTPTICPQATPEPLWVEPVPSHTYRLTETVVVYIGHGEAVTVTCESGAFVQEGDFDAYAHPARVEVPLLLGVTHHLWVCAQVERIEQWGCLYGGYTLCTEHDRYGAPLVVRQQAGSGSVRFLPIVYR
jgi:hypothetical protein